MAKELTPTIKVQCNMKDATFIMSDFLGQRSSNRSIQGFTFQKREISLSCDQTSSTFGQKHRKRTNGESMGTPVVNTNERHGVKLQSLSRRQNSLCHTTSAREDWCHDSKPRQACLAWIDALTWNQEFVISLAVTTITASYFSCQVCLQVGKRNGEASGCIWYFGIK